MRVLIACEFSGIVRDAFIAKGHDAWSCDLLPTERPGPHVQCNVLEVLERGWDLIVAFPPCTHLCSSGALYWRQKQADGRQEAAVKFVLSIYNTSCKTVAIENPAGILSTIWKKPDQYIHPYQFGDAYLKRTGLWLKNLPVLAPTKVVEPLAHWHGGARRGGKRKDGTRRPATLPTALKYGERERSRTFPGIAAAMAEQWGQSFPQT